MGSVMFVPMAQIQVLLGFPVVQILRLCEYSFLFQFQLFSLGQILGVSSHTSILVSTHVFLYTSYENVTAAEECAGIQMAFMPMCCPSQMATIGKDNQCGWCPNGVSDLDVEVELPFSTESVTCGALMFG